MNTSTTIFTLDQSQEDNETKGTSQNSLEAIQFIGPQELLQPITTKFQQLMKHLYLDAPVCVSQHQSLRVSKGEEIPVVCQVEAYPPPTNFK